jgi:phosphoribosyl-ATP pyrophosphohydrolase
MAENNVLEQLYQVILSRRGADPAQSNTAKLFAKGKKKIAQKLGEEAVETLIEGVKGDKTAS